MTLFCKDCNHYFHRSNPEIQYTQDQNIEHQCHAVVSMITGETEIRSAEGMRNGIYLHNSCGPTGSLFKKHTLENLMPSGLFQDPLEKRK